MKEEQDQTSEAPLSLLRSGVGEEAASSRRSRASASRGAGALPEGLREATPRERVDMLLFLARGAMQAAYNHLENGDPGAAKDQIKPCLRALESVALLLNPDAESPPSALRDVADDPTGAPMRLVP